MTLKISLVALLTLVALATPFASHAQSSEGTVTGTIYWDRNADGDRDESEPPLSLGALLMEPASTGIFDSASNSPDGRYTISYTPGTYRIEPSVETSIGICADAFRGSFGPFSPSLCYGAPPPYSAAEPGEPFELRAGETVTIDLPVLVRQVMMFSLRAIEEDGYARAGDTITAVVRGKECGSATVPSATASGEGANVFPLLVDGENATPGCARPGDPVTFHLNDRQAVNPPVAFDPFDPSIEVAVPHLWVRRIDLVFMENWAWFWSDDLRAFDNGEISTGTRIAAVVNGKECAIGRPYVGLLEDAAGEKHYGFGPIMIPATSVPGGCGSPGAVVSFEVGFAGGERIATENWQPEATALVDLVVQRPPRAIGDPPPVIIRPPATGRPTTSESRSDVAPMLLVGGTFLFLVGLTMRRRVPRYS